MLKSEFIKRTHYEPSDSEFSYIFDSYCGFDGGRDAFCKQWVKDKKSGKWAIELKYRKSLNDVRKKYDVRLDELERRLNMYQLFLKKLEAAMHEMKMNMQESNT